MKSQLIRLTIFLSSVFSVFSFGFFKGKEAVKIKQLKSDIRNAKETKKRRYSRRNDDIAIVKRRLQKYIGR